MKKRARSGFRSVQSELPPLWLGWAVPLACIILWGWLLRAFFLR